MLCNSRNSLLRNSPDEMENGIILPGVECIVVIDKKMKRLPLGIVVVGGADTTLGAVIIDKILPDTAAATDGRLKVGDQIISVGSKTLTKCTQVEAIKLLKKSQRHIQLKIWRDDTAIKESEMYYIDTVLLTRIEKEPFGLCFIERPNNCGVLIKTIYPNTVAGRTKDLMVGDYLLELNDIDIRQRPEQFVQDVFKRLTTVKIKYGRLKYVKSAPAIQIDFYSDSEYPASESNNDNLSEETGSKFSEQEMDNGHSSVIVHSSSEDKLLSSDNSTTAYSITEVESKISNQLETNGFCNERLRFQAALVKWMQNNLLPNDEIIVGSMSDCWGFNFLAVDGRISDKNADIFVIWSDGYHFENCKCNGGVIDNNKVVQIDSDGFYSITKTKNDATQLKINQQLVYKCSCKPENYKMSSKSLIISDKVVEKCDHEPVFLIKCKYSNKYIVSYSLQEAILMKHLPVNVGKAFVVLKYIFKKHMTSSGLSTTIAKHLTFYLLRDSKVTSQSTLQLVKRMLFFLKLSLMDKNKPSHICIPNYFSSDGIVFETNSDQMPNKKFIIQEIELQSQNLVELCCGYLKELQSTKISKCFNAQPHCWLSHDSLTLSQSIHKVFLVFHTSNDLVLSKLAEMPASYKIISTTLHVLWLIHNNKPKKAKSKLIETLSLSQYRIQAVVNNNATFKQLKQYINNYFQVEGSMWYAKVHKTQLHHLPEIFHQFKSKNENEEDEEYILINFMSVLNYLRYQQLNNLSFNEDHWYQQLISNDAVDIQELYVFGSMTEDLSQLQWAKNQIKSLSYNSDINETDRPTHKLARALTQRQSDLLQAK